MLKSKSLIWATILTPLGAISPENLFTLALFLLCWIAAF